MEDNNLVEILKKEVERRKKELDNVEKENKKRKIKRLFKKGTIITRIALPFIITCILVREGLVLCKLDPFKREEFKKYLNYEITRDTLGNQIIDESYEPFDSKQGLRYYGNWNYTNGIYTRKIIIFSIKDLTKEDLDKIIDTYSTNIENINLDNILDFININDLVVESEHTIKTNKISELDKPRIEYTYYDTDKEDYILKLEPENQIEDIIINLLALLILELITKCIFKYKNDKLIEKYKEINTLKEYKTLEKKDYEKIYRLALNNYERMTK